MEVPAPTDQRDLTQAETFGHEAEAIFDVEKGWLYDQRSVAQATAICHEQESTGQ
jgi:hypothetical protein